MNADPIDRRSFLALGVGARGDHHLLDPRTGEPIRTAMRSLTVRARRCSDADAAATALFGASREESMRILARATPDVRAIHRIQEVLS